MKNFKRLCLFFGILFSVFINSPIKADAKVQAEILANGEIIEVTGSGKFSMDKDITGFTNYYIGNDMKNPWQASITEIKVSKKNNKLVIKSSICNGEQIADFKDVHTGTMEEVMPVKS